MLTGVGSKARGVGANPSWNVEGAGEAASESAATSGSSSAEDVLDDASEALRREAIWKVKGLVGGQEVFWWLSRVWLQASWARSSTALADCTERRTRKP